MKKNFIPLAAFMVCCFLLVNPLKVSTQVADTLYDDLYEMDLEALMNLDIYSVSKKVESLFDAPLSASVLTGEEIVKSGATTIPEALRMIPGIIVREKTTGNYDVHLRGMDNVQGSKLNFSENTSTLVMIDNRIVYGYFQGGTFWETLPIGIHDIDRIEVVRGPSSALYGSNAVTGVIHIITKKAHTDGFAANANLQAGTLNTKIADAALEYGLKDFKFRLSGNYTFMDRSNDEYYAYYFQKFVPRDTLMYKPVPGPNPFAPPSPLMPTADQYYPDPQTGLDKYGVNFRGNYEAGDNLSLDLSAGMQNSRTQTIYIDNGLVPMNTRDSKTAYANLMADFYGFNARVSYMAGEQDLFVGAVNPNFQYDFNQLDANLEYNYQWKNLTLRPGISYQNTTYDATPYSADTNKAFFDGEKQLDQLAGMLRAEYAVSERLKLVAALRYEKYNKPDDGYLSYQFASLFKLSENTLIRAVYSQANQGPFMLDTYANLDIVLNPMSSTHLVIKGNENLKLPTMNMFELGFRNKLTSYVQSDFEVFYSKMKNFTTAVVDQAKPTNSEYENLALEANQFGMTMNLDFLISSNFRFKVFGTLQSTIFTNYQKPYFIPLPDTNIFFYEQEDLKHRWTPDFYGGATCDYSPIDKLNFYVSAYFYGDETMLNLEPRTYTPSKIPIAGKTIVNLKINYKFWKQHSIYFNARNLLFNDTPEFAYGDNPYGMYLFGLNLAF